MHARALSAVLLSLSLVLLGCADNRAATTGSGAPSAPVTLTASSHGESDATPPPEVHDTPGPAQSLQSVGEAEPPHGSPFQILSGRFAGADVFVSAGRVGSGLVAERTEVRRSKHKGVMVKVVRDAGGQYVTLRCREVVWLLFDSAASPLQAPVPSLTDLADAIIEAC
jgi:hypothetical protein